MPVAISEADLAMSAAAGHNLFGALAMSNKAEALMHSGELEEARALLAAGHRDVHRPGLAARVRAIHPAGRARRRARRPGPSARFA